MARPFPTTFEKDSQLQNQPGGSNPISYQANVNRQKTRKWVDAKAANYGGDDYGDDDDEYDDYDEPPAPVSKQAGLRQPTYPAQNPSQPEPVAADNYKKSYGNLPSAPEARQRANSFDADDERRNFSNQTVIASPQQTSGGPPTQFSQTPGVPNVRQPSGPPPLSVSTQQEEQVSQPGRMSTGDPNIIPSASSDGRFSTGDYQARRDYSPTAAPAPLNARSPGPQSTIESPSARFPARQSSLSHPTGPKLADTRSPQDVQPTPRVASPSASAGKALPFIRPADIYRRAEEERRQSIESGARPSMDALTGPKPIDRTESPGLQPSRDTSSPDNAGGRRMPSIERDDNPGGRYLSSGLEPVQERRSEYGFNGFNVTDHAPKDATVAPSYGSQPLSDSAKLDVQDARRQSTSPKLPDLNRISGFGMDMFMPSKPETHNPQVSYNQSSNIIPPGNNTVKTPDVPLNDEELAPPRALNHAASEQSFRPNLPGGWTSYATTNRTETPQPEDSQSSLRRETESEDEIAPTTTKHSLPQSASGLAIADFETGTSRGEHDNNSAHPPPPPFSESNNTMPTPDSAMAPSGNLYSTTNLDPRLLPTSNSAPTDAPPPPPAKDTPVIGFEPENRGYFPPTSSSHHQAPTFTKDKESDQDENDRLEEEIVSRLSPQPREAPRDSNLLVANPHDTTRESTYLPAEYGDYWASAEDEARTPPLDIGSKQGSTQPGIQNSHMHTTSTGSIESVRPGESQSHPVAPLSVGKSERSNTETSEVERPAVKHRFSWEQSSENVSVAGEKVDNGTGPPPSALSTSNSTSALSGASFPAGGQPIHEMPSTAERDIHQPKTHQDDKIAVEPGSPSTARGSFDDRHIGRDSAIVGGAALTTGAVVAAVAMDHSRDVQPQRRASIAEEKATRVSSYPINVTPPESEHPARSTEPYFPPTSDQASQPPPPSSSVSPINSPIISQPPPSTSRLLAFKEIMNMKSPHQRIQTFDETRHRFAAMDSGLTNWMEALQAQQPEHANSTGSWAASGPGIAKGAKAGGSTSQQPPYYQQYLSASSPTGTPSPTSKPGPSSAAAHQHQGNSPGGPKMTTQQVQAKGKELLHTAGIFGGKAGKAGKGLLAKGKSRFLGGGGDKTIPSPKPKPESRSSWGLPHSKSKSSDPSDKSNRLSRQTTPTPTAEQQRSTTMTSISSQPPQLPPSSTGDDFGTGSLSAHRAPSPPLSPINLPPHQRGEPVASVREIRDPDQSTTESEIEVEERDKIDNSLAPPRPIGKHQPSWDPFNATPIAEEQGSSYDTRPQQSYPFPTANKQQIKSFPGDIPKTEQNDRGVVFHDSVEDQTNIKNDWVMVTPEPEPKQKAQKPAALSTMMHRARGSSGEVPILPAPILTETSSRSPAPMPVSHASETNAIKPDHEQELPVKSGQEEIQPDSTFLPPIRRTSAFGFKFGSRKGRQRFPLEDDDEDAGDPSVSSGDPATANHKRQPDESRSLSQEDSGYSTERPGPNQLNQQEFQSGPPRPTFGPVGSYEQRPPAIEQNSEQQSQSRRSSESRPPLVQASSSEYSQISVASEASGVKTPVPKPIDISSPPANARRSQDAWKPNVAGASGPIQNVPIPVYVPRQSWEVQRPRGASGSSQTLGPRPELSQERQWSMQSKTFEQPPSSAQRYPELFRTGQPVMETHDKNPGDLPAHYYQAPITREAAFLPRQQTSEYQLPGVGPPVDEPRDGSRRNSNFFKDMGGKISRATSRERRTSITQDDEFTPSRHRAGSRVDDDADSSIISEKGRERNKRRSSFFSGLGRGSNGVSNAPHSRESVIAHPSGSRTETPQPSSPIVSPQEKKRSFFSGSTSDAPVTKPSKLSRASMSSVPEPTAGKKKRFSGLGGLFAGKPGSSRGSTPDPIIPTMESSRIESRGPSRSQQNQGNPMLPDPYGRPPPQGQQNQGTPMQQDQYSGPPPRNQQQDEQYQQYQQAQQPQQYQQSKLSTLSKPEEQAHQSSRNPFSKKKTSVAQPPAPQPVQPQQTEPKPRKASKTRRSSAAGLLGGIMGRKNSHDVNSEDSRSQDNQPQPKHKPSGRTYSGIGEQQPQQQPTVIQVQAGGQPQNNPNGPPQERGRQPSREPQYDTVPIPGGYSLVRAQGAQTVPTDYNPRGYQSQPSGPQYPQSNQQQAGQIYGQGDQEHRPPQQTQPTPQQNQNVVPTQASHISALENYRSFVSRQPGRLSREDLIARSPALPVEGQQRPYQLSLPEDNDERDYPVNNNRSPISPHDSSSHLSNTLSAKAQHDPTQRLYGGQQRGSTPQLRHPDSPAGYPLPDDVVFSPINPSAQDFPPPPPPKDHHPAPDHARTFSGSSYLNTFDLNRSGTHRTAISAISGISDHPNQSGRFSPRRDSESLGAFNQREDRGFRNSSPTPPSPAGTPMRIESPDFVITQPQPQVMKTTVLEAPRRLSQDLYDASPLGTPLAKPNGHTRQRSGPPTPNLTIQTQQPYTTSPKPTQPPVKPKTESGSGSGIGNGSGKETGSGKKLAELEGTKADGFNMRLTRQEQEEKIFYDAESGMRGGYGDAPASMSATSYPGQEWNPYGMGAWDDDEEEEIVAKGGRR